MKKRNCVLGIILMLLLCGCSFKQSKEKYPEYFAPIVQELETNWETMPHRTFVMDTWWTKGVQTGIYKEKMYTSYIDKEIHTYDLSDILTDAEHWEWQTAGAFQTEERTYTALVDFNFPGTEDYGVRTPQIILLDYATDNPEDYVVTPYTVEPTYAFFWLDQCYRLNNHIYIASGDDLGVIDVKNRQFYDCKEECSVVKDYAEKEFGEAYTGCLVRATLEQDGIVVYSAEVAETFDAPSIGAVFVAYKDGEPIDYMSVDFRGAEKGEDIKIGY